MSNAETFAWLEKQKEREGNEFRAMSHGSRVSTAKVWDGKVLMVQPRMRKGAKMSLHEPFESVFQWVAWCEENGQALTGVEFSGLDHNDVQRVDTLPLVITTSPPTAPAAAATIAGSTEVPPAAAAAPSYNPLARAAEVEAALQALPDIEEIHPHFQRMFNCLNERLGRPIDRQIEAVRRAGSAFTPVASAVLPRSVTPPPHPPRTAPPPLPPRTRPSNQREERIENLISALSSGLRELAMSD